MNHVRSLGLALASLFWIADQIEKAGIKIQDYADISEESILQLGLYMIVILTIFALIIIIIISVIRNILRYYDLVLKRIPKGFKLEYGLLNRNEISVTDNKMQVFRWSDNLLRKMLGLFTLQIKLASSVSIRTRKFIVIPGIKRRDIDNIKNFYFPEERSVIERFYPIDIYYLWRRIAMSFLFIAVIPFTYLFISSILEKEFLNIYWLIFSCISLFLYFTFTSFLKFRKTRYGFNDEILQINSGIFGDKNAIYSIFKLQGVEITQIPVQVRRNLANLVIYSSAGSQKIMYIDKKKAEQLRDYILYKIETDDREWM